MGDMSAFAGFVGGLLMGAVLYSIGPGNRYSEWLGRECWVRPSHGGRWRRHVVVAVSWKGAVCVRDPDREGKGYWVRKENVRHRVRFDRPEKGKGE